MISSLRLPYLIFKTARPRQWVKNVAIYAALIFSGFFFYAPNNGVPYFWTVTLAFIVFCFVTSTVYLFNDIFDAAADRQHPFKRKRPIASGELPIPIAIFGAITSLAIAFFLSLGLSDPFFRILILLYLVLQFLYSKWLKNIPILDVIAIASGFLIRVYAGAVVVNLHMNVWFLLTVVSASLFLAVGKRQSERTLLGEDHLGGTRQTLKKYSQRLLDQYTGMFANATWLSYALFTFQNNVGTLPANQRFPALYTILPRTLQSEKLLMLTLPFVIFGVMRYLQLVYEENSGESPDLVLFKDKTLLATIFCWGLMVMGVIYR